VARADHVFHLVHQVDAFWFSFVAHILMPQRTTQYAYPMDIAILLILFVAQHRSAKEKV
jgi:hypothetical protein